MLSRCRVHLVRAYLGVMELICSNCRKNLGKTTEADKVGDFTYSKRCGYCGHINVKSYPPKPGEKR